MVDIVTHEEEKEELTAPSAGLGWLDFTLYKGIGFGVNELSSLWITNQFVKGKNLFENMPMLKTMGAWFSKEGFEKAGAWVAKTFKFADKMGKDGKLATSHERGKNAVLMTTLLSGGTLLLLPMKWIEDHKAYWAKKFDHVLDWMHGSKMSKEEIDARDAKVEQFVACSPRQSWGSLLIGRVIAMCSSVATGTFLIGPKKNEWLMDASEKFFTGKIQPANHQGPAHSFPNYARLAAVETYSCALSSIVLEFMSKFFAKKSAKPHDPKRCSQPHADEPKDTPQPPYDDNSTHSTHYRDKMLEQKERGAEMSRVLTA